MAINQPGTERDSARRSDVGRTQADRDAGRNPDANPDPITGAPGSHPVGTGVGAAAGGAVGVGAAVAAGAAMGSAIGPVGTAVGAAVGAIAGGLAGKAVAEEVNPSVEHEYWRQNYASRSYVRPGSAYEDYGPAYQYGWESRSRYGGKRFEEVESNLGRDWDRAKAKSSLAWDHAKHAARDSWERVGASSSASATATSTSADASTSSLNDLIETLKDGQNGFQTAAENVQDPTVKAAFLEFSQQRGRFAMELQQFVIRRGETPEQSGSAAAAVHRGWMNLKSALGGGDKSILNEAERGEDVAKKSYESALNSNLPADAASTVRRQYAEVKQAHDRVRSMRDSRK